MKLAREHFLQIEAALLDGYDRAGLRRMVRLGLDTPLEEITAGATGRDAVFDLLTWAEHHDKVPALIAAAAAHNPQNAALQQLRQVATAWFGPGSEGAAGAGLRASQLAGLHVHFFLATLLHARPGDRGAYVTAAEWLDVNYGQLARELLVGGLGATSLHLIEPTALPFADAATTAAITCFEVGGRPRAVFL